ncbi:DUF2470 domain-containing protein [Streptomyces sp. NPDC021020]|uniref:DUF2470 domain-containing protein n=1 Tax=Streptomyces sp. NPDC021020 TaxID=3365109 RepID=UPI0037A25F10
MTRTADPREPSAAEQVRSILSTAGSAGVTANGAHEDFLTGVAADFDGRVLRLRVPVDSRTAAEASCGPAVGIPAVLEWTDLAPVPVRDRVRARVRITARLQAPEPGPAGAVRLRADVRAVAFDARGARHLVAPGELAAARPDPVASAEARLLLHLAEDHQEHLDELARLLTDRQLVDVTRVVPLALDRHGIVLRLERPYGHLDARLPFPHPLTGPDELGHHIHALLTRAFHERHHTRYGRRRR